MWELDYKESWAPKNWCFWTVVLEKTFESLLDCKEIQPVHPKGNQSWIFIGRTEVEAKTTILWPPDEKNWLIGKDPDAGRDPRQEEKGMRRMVGWHQPLNGHEFEQTPGDGEGLESLACCIPWGHKELDMTEWLSWTVLTCWCLNFECILIIPLFSLSSIFDYFYMIFMYFSSIYLFYPFTASSGYRWFY